MCQECEGNNGDHLGIIWEHWGIIYDYFGIISDHLQIYPQLIGHHTPQSIGHYTSQLIEHLISLSIGQCTPQSIILGTIWEYFRTIWDHLRII